MGKKRKRSTDPIIPERAGDARQTIQSPYHLPRWFLSLLAATTVFCVAAAGFRPLFDNDVGFQIRIGSTILENGWVPKSDHHSFTADGAEYIDQEWLSQVFLYGVDRLFGVKGLVLAGGLIVLLAFGLLARASRDNRLASLAIILVCAAVAVGRVQIRPHLIAWFFIGALLVLQRGKRRFAIAVLLCIWANAHASFLLALIMTLIWTAENYWETRDRRWLFWAGVFVAAPLLNPFGPKIYLVALTIKEHKDIVREWQPYSWSSGILWVILAYFLLVAVGIVRRPGRRIFNGARLAVLAVLTFSARRHGIESMLYLAPVAAGSYAPVIERLPKKAMLAFACLIAAAGLGMSVYLIREKEAFNFKTDIHALPVKSTEFLLRHRLCGNVFNDYNFGGYLLWKAWPECRVFVDGRLEVYGPGGQLDEYLRVENGLPGWQGVLDKYKLDVCIVRGDRAIARRLAKSSTWELAYFDYNSAVFLRHGASPEIRRLKVLNPWGGLETERTDEAIEEAEYLLGENPLNHGVNKILAYFLYKKGDLRGAADNMKRFIALAPEEAHTKDNRKIITILSSKGFWP